jgi:hydroxymethylbilane synthase
MTTGILRMGTRASALAKAQSGDAAAKLTKATGVPVETVLIRTEGDQLSTEGRAPSGGDSVGVFTRALDEALRGGKIDFAVHSLKDLPTDMGEDLCLAAVPLRADPRDALVIARRHLEQGIASLAALPKGAVIATSSPRRVAQLLRLRPDFKTVSLAGNVDTRLRRLEEGVADALLLACAGLDRLGLSDRIVKRLEMDEILSAPGQGALAMACLGLDERTRGLLVTQDHRPSHAAATAERSFLNALRGGCRAPVGASAIAVGEAGDRLHLRGSVLSLDGRERLDASGEASIGDAEALGRSLAEQLLSQGAERLVAASRDQNR